MRGRASILPKSTTPSVETLAASAMTTRQRRRAYGLLGLLIVLNLGIVAGMIKLRADEKRARAPVAAMAVAVKELTTQQADTRAELAGTRAQLEETRSKVDKQASVLATTVDTVTVNAQRQKEAERLAKENDARELRELAALAARVKRVEKRGEEGAYKLSEAIKLIDFVQGAPGAAPAKSAPPSADAKKLNAGTPSPRH